MKSMKKIGVLSTITIIFFAFTLFVNASNVFETINATLRKDIKILINGHVFQPRDQSGKDIAPVIINGSTYLPVRAVAEAINLPVDWDGETNSVILGARVKSKNLIDFQMRGSSSANKIVDQYSLRFQVGDIIKEEKQFEYGIEIRGINSASRDIRFTLDGGYTYFSGVIGNPDPHRTSFRIRDYDKDTVLYQKVLEPGEFLVLEDIELYNVRTIEFTVVSSVGANNHIYILEPTIR
ncbi:copper amine oxidase-like protein [Natranaerovirga pectinivora]|uniref:Copper amine oxidase-like protein n=1 Tax=Natranaerovirga pectinivora TaxID=682400 RepID=A0A4R3MP51_9FIRM|nr:copper amine oxidase N-terminal domain-containing protein [Natranaerovirga pectinivora]TCT15369.1 copper amine oxidase-like protein [Natranaerovirga pectinivora]